MRKILFLMGWVAGTVANAQDTARAEAAVSSATVYFGYGAELTHQSKVTITANTRTIVIGQLATSIDINSLQISCPEDVALLSHKYSVYTPELPPLVKTPEYRKIEDSITAIQQDNSRIQNQISIQREILEKTGKLIETMVSVGGNKPVTSEDVLKLVEYYNAKIEKAKNSIYQYEQTIIASNRRVSELQVRLNELQQLAPKRAPSYGQIILQVISKRSGEIPVALSYYTNNAGWTPVYDIRVNSKTNKVKLVYKAALTQTTGIFWKKTKLTLSTGTPSFGTNAPVLAPWFLQIYVPGIYTDLQRRAAVGNATRNVVQSYGDDKVLSEVVVRGQSSNYEFKKTADTIDPSTLQSYTTLNEGQLNTNFEIDLPYDIESDGQLHSVSIKDEEITCLLKNYAVPRADKEAYLMAEIANWQNLDLLPGDANIIMDETYVGKSVIDPNTTADTLNLSLGKDKRIAVKRSLVKELSSLKTSGRDTKQTFTYEIIVKNNKLTDVNLLLKDQYPLSTIKEVEVKLEDDGNAAVNEETGVLTWKIDLKPGESRRVRFTYTVKYPKDKKIVNLK
ncbi:DUF4139 domain-containing protein [Terrimonas ferruginea]|uniref:DUF4139 domain-containing protein n=1 Tax=Terrimonas ferruginea TaxID=249 RepID=UPI00041C58DB|nr:DUF4139 domain-containing protein [Terrimonas ferruginea]